MGVMGRWKFLLGTLLLPLVGQAQTASSLDAKVQAPELSAPQRGSLVGQYASVAFGPADVSRGGFSLPAPFQVPSDRGALQASIFPVYAPDSGLSEWGQGWGATLAFTRWRPLGALDYATDGLSGPWGRFVRGDDGHWYPQNLAGQVRLVEGPDTLVAHLPDGSRWTFGGTARVTTARGTYAWYLTEVESALGRRTRLEYVTNTSGRHFLKAVSYGGVGDAFQYRVELEHETTPYAFRDWRSGQEQVLDRRVKTVVVKALHAATGLFEERWRHVLTWQEEGLGPAYYLTQVQQVFPQASVQPPPTRYTYQLASEHLATLQPRAVPKLDALLTRYGTDVIQPNRTAPFDPDEDGRMDLELALDYSLLRQQDGEYVTEALPAAADAAIACRRPNSAFNVPRNFAQLRDTDTEHQVVSLQPDSYRATTALTVCDRPGRVLATQQLTGDWGLAANVRLVDLDKDRRPDLVRVAYGRYSVRPNVSTATTFAFGAERTGNLRPLFTPDTSWVHDFNGDGVPDLISRYSGGLVVWWGRGDATFVEQGQTFQLRSTSGVTLTNVTDYYLSFVDTNKDGLTDALLTRPTGSAAYLFVNKGNVFQQVTVQALTQAASYLARPVIADLAGSGDTEVIYSRAGKAESLALDAAGTGLMKSADDGRGAVLRFEFKRGPAVAGARQRQSVLAALQVESSGHDAIRYTYDYAQPTLHGQGRFLVGFDRVTRVDPTLSHAVDFLNGDDYSGLLASATRLDAHTPDVKGYEYRTYEDALFHGVPWKRLKVEGRGWASLLPTGAPPAVEEKTEYLAYEADLCPSLLRATTAHGTLVTEKTRATVTGLPLALHCLESRTVQTGTHADASLDFRQEVQVERNAVGLVTAVHSLAPGNTLTQQQVTYTPDYLLSELAVPGRGVTRFAHDPATRLLQQVTAPDGVVTRVAERHPLTDGLLALEEDRGALVYRQSFRYDGQERLEKRWDNLAGSELSPRTLYAYRFATATTPASVFSSTLVDAQAGAVKDGVEYLTAAGEKVTSARRIPQGWVFDGLVQRIASRAEAVTRLRPTVDGAVDVQALDYATLFAGGQQVGFSRTSAFGHVVESSTAFHSAVEKQVAVSLGLEAGQLVQTVLENGTWRTLRRLDASRHLVAFEDEANTRYGYRYDALARLRQVDLPDGTKHRVHFDGHGRVSLLEREGVATVQYGYDATTGLLTLKRFGTPTGVGVRQVALSYDAIGRLAEERHTDFAGSAPEVFLYYRDGATPAQPGARTALGTLSAVTGTGYTKLFEHRADGLLHRRTVSLTGWRTVTTTLDYFEDGSVREEATVVTDAAGAQLSSSVQRFTVDVHGRVDAVHLDGALAASLGYDANGLLSAATFSGGESVLIGYDALTRKRTGLSQSTPDWSVSSSQRFDSRGFVGSEDYGFGALQLTRTYGYSAPGFLTGAVDSGGPGKSYAYGYDTFGRPASIEDDGLSRVLARSGATLDAGDAVYQYDGLGRVIQRGDLVLTYGPHGHVTRATRGSNTWTFLHDEEGQRLAKLVNGTPVVAYVDGDYLDATGLTEPVRLDGLLVGVVQRGVLRLRPVDLRGTVTADAAGQPLLASPFGDRDVHPQDAAALDYVEKGYDADLGLIRMGVRDYDARISQFITPDPLFLESPERCLKSPVECNLYGYARNSPLVMVDPSGMQAKDKDAPSASSSIRKGADVYFSLKDEGAPFAKELIRWRMLGMGRDFVKDHDKDWSKFMLDRPEIQAAAADKLGELAVKFADGGEAVNQSFSDSVKPKLNQLESMRWTLHGSHRVEITGNYTVQREEGGYVVTFHDVELTWVDRGDLHKGIKTQTDSGAMVDDKEFTGAGWDYDIKIHFSMPKDSTWRVPDAGRVVHERGWPAITGAPPAPAGFRE